MDQDSSPVSARVIGEVRIDRGTGADIGEGDDGGDLAAFEAAQDEFRGLAVVRAGSNAQEKGLGQDLAAHFRGREESLARRMHKAVESRDMGAMIGVATDLADVELEGDLTAKAIGKSVSAIDQLTKLN